MARVTVEDCLGRVENMYELVHLTTKRVRQLVKGSDPLVESKNKLIVTALREIAAGKVTSVMNQPAGVLGGDSLENLVDPLLPQ